MSPTTVQWVGAMLFALAIVHTFSVKYFERLAHRYPKHSGTFHFLGEVGAVFGFWALMFVFFNFSVTGKAATVDYLEGRNFTEPINRLAQADCFSPRSRRRSSQRSPSTAPTNYSVDRT